MSLNSLVAYAYAPRGSGSRVDGGPDWTQSQPYDIEAKVDESQMAGWDKLSSEERTARVRPMLRALLAERFQLKLHTEMRETPVYALVQAKGGAKLKQAVPPEPTEGEADKTQKTRYMDDHPGKAAPGYITCSGNGCIGKAFPIKIAIGQFGASADADRIVIDQTGLTGYYDFSYTISRDPDSLTPMQQIEDQLGLRFESRKIPMKTYVIDSAEKPTQN
jgi:uncharacterized protein (TIGR03435 family)